MRSRTSHRSALFAPAALLAACTLAAGCGGGGGSDTAQVAQDARVAPISSAPYGKSYAQYAAGWWQWLFTSAKADEPVEDQTGAKGHLRQSGSVWYLAGTYGGAGTRSLTVPPNTSLFLPLLNNCYILDPSQDTEESARAQAKESMDHAVELRAELDGVAIPDLWSYRSQTTLYTFTSDPNDPLYPVAVDPSWRFLGDGYWLMLNPLPSGQHTLRFGGKIVSPGSTPGDTVVFETDATYNLTVQ